MASTAGGGGGGGGGAGVAGVAEHSQSTPSAAADLSLSGSAYVEGGMEGVQGMLCADARGLCVQAKGVADPNAAGLFTALVRRAGALAPADEEPAPPTVLIETERHNIIVKEYDDLTLAVYTAASGGGGVAGGRR